VMRVSCNFMAERFSHPSTTTSAPLTPTAQVPIEGISHRNKAVNQKPDIYLA